MLDSFHNFNALLKQLNQHQALYLQQKKELEQLSTQLQNKLKEDLKATNDKYESELL